MCNGNFGHGDLHLRPLSWRYYRGHFRDRGWCLHRRFRHSFRGGPAVFRRHRLEIVQPARLYSSTDQLMLSLKTFRQSIGLEISLGKVVVFDPFAGQDGTAVVDKREQKTRLLPFVFGLNVIDDVLKLHVGIKA